jgi:hypothetical protein
VSGVRLAHFEGGPFHEMTMPVELLAGAGSETPDVLVTDEGGHWFSYVQLGRRDGRPLYRYAGGASASEVRSCPRVTAGGEHGG